MATYQVIYTRHAEGWTAELLAPSSLTLSRSSLAETQAAMRGAAAPWLALEPGEFELEELIDAGERQYARLA
ncbi:MAG: hypothetical protein QOI76_1378 [Frankiales bacterium]|jgi:hypothetical protein|nr:hypothetical protein [Frankiales bacterium]MDX6256664.1 hypothetical protein [Frankiales bacterium]